MASGDSQQRGGLQVLVLGMPRTGTTSIRLALRQVGFNKHYYWSSLGTGSKPDPKMWINLLEQKFNKPDVLITRQQFDVILGDYTSCADFPISIFAEDLIAAYPDAKVILSVRDTPDAWFKSFNDTIWGYHRPKYLPKTLSEWFWSRTLVDKSLHKKVMDLIIFNTPLQNFPEEGRQWYIDHNAKIRSLVPPERLLEFNAKDGWEPLCKCLTVDQPTNTFPVSNGSENFQKGTTRMSLKQRARKTQKWLDQLMLGLVGAALVLIMCEVKYRLVSCDLRFWSSVRLAT